MNPSFFFFMNPILNPGFFFLNPGLIKEIYQSQIK